MGIELMELREKNIACGYISAPFCNIIIVIDVLLLEMLLS